MLIGYISKVARAPSNDVTLSSFYQKSLVASCVAANKKYKVNKEFA